MKWIRYIIEGEILIPYDACPFKDMDGEIEWFVASFAERMETELQDGFCSLPSIADAEVTMSVDDLNVVDIPGRFVGSVPCKEDS